MASLSTGELLYEFEKPTRFISRIAVSDDGTIAAMAFSCERVFFYDAQTGKKTHSLKVGAGGDVSGLAFAPGTHNLLHSSWRVLTAFTEKEDGSFSVYRLPVPETWPDNPMYYAVAFSPLGGGFVCILRQHLTNSAALFRWPLDTDVRRVTLADDSQPPTTWQSYNFSEILFAPDEHSFLLMNPDGSVGHYSLADAASQTPVILPTTATDETEPRFFLGNLCFSPDGSLLAYKLNGVLGLWAWSSCKCLGKWKASGPKPYFDHMSFSNSGRELVISFGGSPSGIFVYRTADFIGQN